jgi:hypothetical protein
MFQFRKCWRKRLVELPTSFTPKLGQSRLRLKRHLLMKNAVFWDVTTCGSCKNQRFGGKYCFYQEGEKSEQARNNFSSITAKVVPTSLILYSHSRENLKSYNQTQSSQLYNIRQTWR